MKNKLQQIVIDKDHLLDTIDTIENTIKTTTLPALNDVVRSTADKTVISGNILFSDMKEDEDSKIFKRIFNVVDKYVGILPLLKDKVKNDLPDSMTSNTSDLNVRLTLAIISEGVMLSSGLSNVLTYVINKFYTDSSSELDESIVKEAGKNLNVVLQLTLEMEKTNLEKVIDAIGDIPTIKALKYETTSDIPSEVIMGFFKDVVGIKSFYTQSFIKNLLGYFDIVDTPMSKNDKQLKRFIGNPIYHLRLFMIDLDLLKLEKLKDEKRLLELKVLELRSKDTGNDKLQKQIKYYENKVNKINLKIEKLSKY